MKAHSAAAILALLFAVVACDDSNTKPLPTATPTLAGVLPAATPTPSVPPTPVPTSTPTVTTSGQVVGLAVLAADAVGVSDEAPNVPPPAWLEEPDAPSFPHALGGAQWTLEGPVVRSGSTAADGAFAIGTLPPGEYRLSVSRIVGGVALGGSAGFVVRDGAVIEIVLQVDHGGARVVTTNRLDGHVVRHIVGPDASEIVVEDERVVALGDAYRSLIDVDGDGTFVPRRCLDASLWACEDPAACGDGRSCICTASCLHCDDCGPSVCAPALDVNPYRCGENGSCARPGDACVCVSSCPACRDCRMTVCVPSCAPLRVTAVEIDGMSQVSVGRRTGLRARAVFDDGSEIDVTALAAWSSSNPAVATVDSWGVVIGRSLGSVEMTASLGSVQAAPHPIEVVERAAPIQVEAYVQDCIVPTRPPVHDDATAPIIFPFPACSDTVRVGGSVVLIAFATFADGSFEVVTDRAVWNVEPNGIGRIDHAMFVAEAAGEVTLHAVLDGVSSPPLELRVVEAGTPIALYVFPAGVVPPGMPRPEELSPPFCPDCGGITTLRVGERAAFQAMAQYDTGEWGDVTQEAYWLIDDEAVAILIAPGMVRGEAEGETSLHAMLGDLASAPVQISVEAELGESFPCRWNTCGNGCGYVHRCGATPPIACPAICQEICECPPGWGITDAGMCERCTEDCCAPGEACDSDWPPCEPPRDCCPRGELCFMVLPPCEPPLECCPPGQICEPGTEPCPIACCPENARCTADIPPCPPEPRCCPLGALCGPLDLPPCEVKCCAPGQVCPDILPPCDEEPDGCVVTGCSGQICADRHMASTCEWLPEYACYRDADCAPQPNGTCGWTPSDDLQRCIDEARRSGL